MRKGKRGGKIKKGGERGELTVAVEDVKGVDDHFFGLSVSVCVLGWLWAGLRRADQGFAGRFQGEKAEGVYWSIEVRTSARFGLRFFRWVCASPMALGGWVWGRMSISLLFDKVRHMGTTRALFVGWTPHVADMHPIISAQHLKRGIENIMAIIMSPIITIHEQRR